MTMLPFLRVKRPAGNATFDTVHVRLLKRRRLSRGFKALSISPSAPLSSSQLSPQPSSNCEKRARTCVDDEDEDEDGNEHNNDSTVVIFRRVDTSLEASTTTTPKIDETKRRIVDIDSSFLNITNNRKRNENETGTETETYVMFAAATTATTPDTEGQENEVVAYVDAENIEQLGAILDEALIETSDDDDDDDARTVDYPSTPEQVSDDDGYHFEEESSSDDDYNDYERYEVYGECVQYEFT